jgi:hypothetical protein
MDVRLVDLRPNASVATITRTPSAVHDDCLDARWSLGSFAWECAVERPRSLA